MGRYCVLPDRICSCGAGIGGLLLYTVQQSWQVVVVYRENLQSDRQQSRYRDFEGGFSLLLENWNAMGKHYSESIVDARVRRSILVIFRRSLSVARVWGRMMVMP